MSQKVIAREYKAMLQTKHFSGAEAQLLDSATKFWDAFSQAIHPIVISVGGDLQDIKKKDRRNINFYDTDSQFLYQNDYILRERQQIDSDKREVTLKFRHPDRYISQDRNLDAAGKDQEATKFEEDIKSSKDSKFLFSVLYSFSTTQDLPAVKRLNQLKDVAKLYPALADQLPHFKAEEALHIVKHTVRELVIKGGTFQLTQKPDVYAECALIAWYSLDKAITTPVVVEFSFRYGDEKEDYSRKLAQRGYDVFQALQQLTDWVDPHSQTKTAYIYSNE